MKKFHIYLILLACLAATLSQPHIVNASAITLTATVDTASSPPSVTLQWTDLGRDAHYDVYRDYQKVSTQTTSTWTDTPTGTSQTHDYCVYASGGRNQTMTVSNDVSITLSGPPSAPTGLSADPTWVTSCPLCNGMAMAHIVLNWTPVPAATGYNVYRNGTLLQSNMSTPTDTDMTVVSGQSYTYAVSAVTPAGASPQSAPVSATAPNPPTLTPPTNLRVQGFWQGAPSDVLTWDAVAGAASYNVYRYDTRIASGDMGTSYTVPFDQFYTDLTYTVTAVDAMGMESAPSNLAGGIGGFDPANPPAWLVTTTPNAPYNIKATVEWNAGKPRVLLIWQGEEFSGPGLYLPQTHRIYRDGILVADGMWDFTYLDNHVQPGETHSYTVSAINPIVNSGAVGGQGVLEGPQSAPITASVPINEPAFDSVQTAHITSVMPNDDSALVSFAAVAGAVDYRIYDTSAPMTQKYSDGALSIQWNGIDPAKGADLIVEAVDKLGPFQTMDGTMGPGAGMGMAINGHGDPSNIPNVIARSAPFHVTCQPRTLTGDQAFFDNFRNEQPLKPSALPNALAAESNPYVEIQDQTNDKWLIRTYNADTKMTSVFFDHDHFMDTLYDGPTAVKMPFTHNNDASMVMIPKATADISDGRVLHVTFEVDAHMDNRRWIELFVAPAGDDLLHANPTKLNLTPGEMPTTSGNMFMWQITHEYHDAQEFIKGQPQELVNLVSDGKTDPVIGPWDVGTAITRNGDWGGPTVNGTIQDLDKRHRFDLYLSQTHFRLLENGVVCKDRDLIIPLPFSQCQVDFVHELYHTANDRGEIIDFTDYCPDGSYWYNYRPWSDERHWDNMGFEVLPSFPE